MTSSGAAVQDGSRGIRLALFFTWDVSLAVWRDKGLLQREIRLYQALADKGAHVTFLSWGGEEDRDVAEALAPAIKTISLYDYIPRPRNKMLRAVCSLWVPFVLRKKLKDADILKTNQMWGGWVAALAKLVTGRPLLMRCGYEYYDFTVRQGHGALRRGFAWLISQFTYSVASHICVATPEDKDFVMRTFRQPDKKISVHPNWIDTDFFAPAQQPQKEKTILYVGRLTEQKNLPMLIDALAGTDFALDIVGEGELRRELERSAAQKNVLVRFLGRRPNDELPGLYNSYPVYILPSFYEGNPKTLLEAMACGRAVIGTDAPGIASVIAHEKSGLLCAPEAGAIRAAITRLMDEEPLRAALGRAAREQIVSHQTLDRLLSMELACYDSLTKRET